MLLLKVIHTRVLALTARGTPLQPALARFRPPAVLAQSNEPLGLGWLPLLSLLAAGGLLCVAVAFTYSRAGSQQIEPLFWLGLLLIVVPGLIRLAGSDAERAERLSLVILIGLSLYLVKVMHSPYAFTYSDEFLHAFNTQQILTTGRLFTVNPILTVSALYPGLPLLTAALTSLTGLSVFQAGLVVIGAARLVLMLALFLLYEQIGASPRVAGLGVLLYAANANFVYWSSQFGYESLSLPLAVLVLYLVRRRQTAASAQKRLAWTLAAALGIGAVVITHHLTSYFLVVFLLIWTLFHHNVLGWLRQRLIPAGAPHLVWLDRLRPRPAAAPRPDEALRPREPQGWAVSPALLAAVALGAAAGWLVLVAGQTVNYLFPVLGRAVGSVVGLIAGEETSRELFRSTTGYVAPVWERVAGISSVVLALIGLPVGLGVIWKRYRRNALALMLGLAAGGYFVVLGLRFSQAAWETGNRASAYLFLGLAFTLALAVTAGWERRHQRDVWRGILTVSMAIVFCGGIIAGWAPPLRLAQTYLVRASDQTIEPQGAAVSRWMLANFGPGQGVVSDETNSRYLMTLGQQRAYAGSNPDIVDILKQPHLDDWMVDLLQDLRAPYVVADRRRVSWDNMSGYYFDLTRGQPLTASALFEPERNLKFDLAPRINRVLDSGNIIFYDLRALINVPASD